MIPPSIGNLSKLRYLDLQAISYPRKLWASDLHWLPNLSSLEYLNLGGVNLNKTYEGWLQAINMLPSLLELHLSKCNLGNSLQSLPHLNLTLLLVFYLSFNRFNSSSILQWLFNITTLFNLNLSWSNLGGPIPKVIKGCLCNLQTLDLSSNYDISGEIEELVNDLSGCSNVSLEYLDLTANKLSGHSPISLGYLKHLKYLSLSYNSFSGLIPPCMGNLSNLESMYEIIPESIGELQELWNLNLFYNSWEGVISEDHFHNLTNLSWLSLSSSKNSLVLKGPWKMKERSLSCVRVRDLYIARLVSPVSVS